MPVLSFFSIFLFSFVMGFGAVISPGPVSTAIVSQSPRMGWKTGPLIAMGHALMELGMVFLISFGLSSIMATSSIQVFIALIGGFLLIWMGGEMVWGVIRGKTRIPQADGGMPRLAWNRMFMLGIITTLSNPFWYAWWATVVPGYLVEVRAVGFLPVAAFYLGHVSADFSWDTMLSTVISGGRHLLSETVYRTIMVFCGTFLVYLGGTFIWKGIEIVSS